MKFDYKVFIILSLSFFIIYQAFALDNSRQSGKTVIVDNKLGNFPLVQLSSYTEGGQVFISLNDFVNKTGFGIYTNDSRQKSVLYIGKDKATFSAANNFVILNDHMYQLPYFPIWKDAELWVPVNMLVELFTNFTPQTFSFDQSELILTLGMKDVNLTGVAIEARDNGTLIKIRSRKKFKKKDIALKVTNGWLHIDVYGGTADPLIFKNSKPSGVVSEIDVIEFETLVSIAFKLNKKIISRELVINDDNEDFYVNLRTNEVVEVDTYAQSELEKQKKDWLIDTIILDAGHGGKDPGAVGKAGLREKDIALAVTLKLGQMIKKNLPGVQIVYTRDKDIFIPLWQRTQIANENRGKLFVSLHCNSNTNKKIRGVETYFLSADKDKNAQAQAVVLKENESIKFEKEEDQKRYEGINFILATMAQSAFIRQSQHFASTIQNSFAQNLKPLGIKDRGVKQGRFWVMVGATMPNVLVEMGYISNRNEGNFLKQKSNQVKVAQAIFNGIKKYKEDIEAAI